jgi:hypothetical protein
MVFRYFLSISVLSLLFFAVPQYVDAQENTPLERQPEEKNYDPNDRDTRTVRERPRDAIDTGERRDEKADIKGFFIQAGPAGGLEVGNGREFGIGPGAQVGLGYIFKGPVGLRGTFTFLSMESDGFPQSDGELYNGSVDLMLIPFYRSRFFVQPYLVLGPGYYYLDSDALGISQHGFGGNAGLGANIHLTEHFALGLENNFRPVKFFANNGRGDDDKYFYSFTAFGTFFF